MKELLDAFWRALAYCLHPRVIALSLLPLVIGAGLSLLAYWLFWDAAVAGVQARLESWTLVAAALQWLERVSGAALRTWFAPAIVVMLVLPIVVVLSVLLVGLLMTPAIVSLVAARRFAQLERRQGGGVASSLWVSLSSTALALVALVVTMPLWFVPPLILVLPPLIWGWLTYRVMSHDALAEYADAAERRELLRRHRVPLLAIGVLAGYLGAVPSLLWALNAVTLVFAPVLIPLSVWLYTLVFAFGALWFVHYALAALRRLRSEAQPPGPAAALAAPEPMQPSSSVHALPPP
jgi:Etoposide-induced protein 2.4 (EI24)